jgi:hypothetical protein
LETFTPGGVTSGVVEKYTLDEDEGDHDRDNRDGEDEKMDCGYYKGEQTVLSHGESFQV